MAKSKTPAKPKAEAKEPTEALVEYDLFALPTAFHKAGLAGLVLLIESLKARNLLTDEDAKYEMTATAAKLTFTEPLVRKLMDDIYDARIVEVFVKSKWPGAELKREETVEEEVAGKKVKFKRFVYDQVQPKGAFFDNVFDGDKEVWRKLWRDMLWSISRGRPTTRIPFNERAAGTPCGEGEAGWSDLLKVVKARGKNGFHTAELSSALFPGAQALNAEGVPFEGRAEQNLLLHFWPFVTLLFQPNKIERDGSSDFSGYTLAVPEVGDLVKFVDEFPRILASLGGKARGYRPAEAVIDIAAEGGLAFLTRLAEVTGQNLEERSLKYSIRSVEYLHLVKEGNNIKTMAAGRVSPNRDLLRDYRSIVTPNGKEPIFRNPLFRRGLLLALLDGKPWYEPFLMMFAAYDVDVFLRQPRRSDDAESKAPPQFAADAATKLRHETQSHTATLERLKAMPEADRPKTPTPLSVIVNRVVRGYLLARTTEKSGVKLDAFEGDDERVDWSKVPAEFNEAKQKLAVGLTYEFRSRKEQAFAEHFATTFFSVTQRLGEADRIRLADALTLPDERDSLKILTLLSLSANS